jgi:hypothetical protein
MTDQSKLFATHPEPVWRDKANFVINMELPPSDSSKQFEQLWSRQVGDDEFEVCCIPFFVYDLALGDVVRTAPKGGRRCIVDRVVKPSGRYTFRVWFGKSFHPRDELVEDIQKLGSLIEWSSRNMVAVDAVDAEQAQRVADFLSDREQRQQLIYETGRTA